MRVIRATISNFSDVWELHRLLYAERCTQNVESATRGMDSTGIMMMYHRLMGFILSGNNVILVVYDEDCAVGYMHLGAYQIIGSDNAPIASSYGVYVLPKYRRGKASYMLLRAVKTVLREWNRPYLQAIALTENTAAAKLYEDHSFRAIGTVYEREVRDERQRTGKEGDEIGQGCDGDGAGRDRRVPEQP